MNIWIAVLKVGCALAAVCAACVLMNVLRKKWGDSVCYDERQMAARGRAFTAAYGVLFCWMIGVTVGLEEGLLARENAATALFLGVLVSTVTLVTLLVLGDAYTAFLSWIDGHEMLTMGYLIFMAGFNFYGFFCADVDMMPGFSLEDGPWLNLVAGMTFLYVAILFLIRWRMGKREEADG